MKWVSNPAWPVRNWWTMPTKLFLREDSISDFSFAFERGRAGTSAGNVAVLLNSMHSNSLTTSRSSHRTRWNCSSLMAIRFKYYEQILFHLSGSHRNLRLLRGRSILLARLFLLLWLSIGFQELFSMKLIHLNLSAPNSSIRCLHYLAVTASLRRLNTYSMIKRFIKSSN